MGKGQSALQVGVVVTADRMHAAFASTGSAPVLASAPMVGDPVDVLTALDRDLLPAGAIPDAVVIDISSVLLDAVAGSSPDAAKVAVIRGVPRAAQDPLVARSPSDQVERLVRSRYTVPGGHDLLGNELHPLDLTVLTDVCRQLVADDVRHVAVVAPGSQARPQHERAIADAVQAALPGARVSAASDFGGQGLIVREATVVFDCALGDVVDSELARWEAALAQVMPETALRIARGDGGYTTPAWARALVALTLGATGALALSGAARLAGSVDCRVRLRRDDVSFIGNVRNGLPVIRSAFIADLGTALVVPTAVLTIDVRGDRAATPETDIQQVNPEHHVNDLAAAGAAVAQPTAWLDEVAYIESAAELDRVRRDVSERARAIVMANGAVPGTDYITELSAVAVPYSPSGTVRIRVRVVGSGHGSRPSVSPR